jgi:hypothetical protein
MPGSATCACRAQDCCLCAVRTGACRPAGLSSGRSRVKTYLRCRANAPHGWSVPARCLVLFIWSPFAIHRYRPGGFASSPLGARRIYGAPAGPLRASLHPSARLFSISFFMRMVWTPQRAKTRRWFSPGRSALPGSSPSGPSRILRTRRLVSADMAVTIPGAGSRKSSKDAFILPDRGC